MDTLPVITDIKDIDEHVEAEFTDNKGKDEKEDKK